MPKRNTGPRVKWRKDRNVWEVGEYAQRKWRRLKSGFTCREDAEGWLAQYLVTGKTTSGPSHPDQRLIGDSLADYVVDKGPYIKSKKTLAYSIEKLSDFWGDKTAGTIREATCRAYMKYRNDLFQKWQTRQMQSRLESLKKTDQPLPYTKSDIPELLKEISPAIVRRELGVLTAALNQDYKEGRLTAAPFVWKPQDGAFKERFLTRDEFTRLLISSRNSDDIHAKWYLPVFCLIGIYTGARKSAILNLRWHQVKLDKGYIDFRPPGSQETNKRYPRVPIHRRLRTVLRIAKKRGTDMGYVIHMNQRPLADIKKGFAAACNRAELKDVTPYTLRHTAASWMVQKGVPTYKVATYLGNSVEMIEKHYGHLAPDHMKDAMDALG